MLDESGGVWIYMFSVYGIVMLWQIIRQSNDSIYKLTDFKPINCSICLSFWIGLLVSITHIDSYLGSFLYASSAAGFTYLLRLIEEGIRQ